MEGVRKRKIQKRHNNSPRKKTHMNMQSEADFSLSLAKHVISAHISAHGRNTNLIISPLSIRVVLGMIAAGSNGPTRDQILGFLKSKSIEELNSLSSQLVTHVFADGEPLGGPRLSTANGVWIDQTLRFKPAFNEIVQNAYKAASKHVDFQTKANEVRNEVNKWVDKETNGLIKDILPPGSVDATTRLILANAVYFKGAWVDKFDASRTKDDTFFLLDGRTVKVPLMTDNKRQYIGVFDGFKVLKLPYKQGQDERKFSMYFFLPDAKDGLPALLEKVSYEPRFIENHIPHQKVSVGDFRVPKFKIGFIFEASKVLKGLGVALPFRMGGLTKMVDSATEGKLLYVSQIYHKSFIEVNEKGTEAAAATVARMFIGCARGMKKIEFVDFVADHPFMFVIREDMGGEVLFIGQLLNPLDA